MNTEKSFLITRPEHDLTTRYLSKWSEGVIDEAEKKHIECIDLNGGQANRERFIGTLEEKAPDFVFLNGHGNADIVYGHENTPLLVGSDDSVKDKIIYARACKSAKRLGSQIIENGATAYIGYDEDFVFMYETHAIGRPLEDETARLFLEPSNQIALSILEGQTVEEAERQSQEKFRQNIHSLFYRKHTDEEEQMIFFLALDLQRQICLGNKNAKI